jgi:hypothetical protein
MSSRPKLKPSSDTLTAAVVATFEADMLLSNGAMKVNTTDTLPTASPLVIILRRAQPVPEAALHATELSEVQVVVSARVAPNRMQLL